MLYTEEQIQQIWEKGRKIEGLDPDMYRLDACGALIMRDKYDMTNKYGWVVDHIFPRIKGGDDTMINLRPLHYLNNISKAGDYPSYTSAVHFDGLNNIERNRNLAVNKKLRNKLKEIYKDA